MLGGVPGQPNPGRFCLGASTGQCFQQSSGNTEMQLCSNCRRITSLRSLFIFSHKSHKLLFLEQQQTNAHIRRSGSPQSPSPSWSETGYQLPQAACHRLRPGTSGPWGRGLSPHPPSDSIHPIHPGLQLTATALGLTLQGTRMGPHGPQYSWQPAQWPSFSLYR